MTKLINPSVQVDVSTDEETVVAGQPFEVTVRLVADRLVEISDGEVELVRGAAVTHSVRQWGGAGGPVSVRSSAVIARAALDLTGPLGAGQQLVRRITVQTPPGEATIAGQLVQQHYTLRARIHAAGGRGGEAAAPVTITSADAGREWIADMAPAVDDAGFAVLGFEESSSRRLVAGVPVTGVVTVAPGHTGSARAVRVELVLGEHVPARADEPTEEDRDAATVVTAVPVAEHLDLEPGRVLRWPFTLRVPIPLPAPSISTPEFTLRWLLRAVLDRPLRPDPTTTVELWGTTAP
jgi:hypothetical protein